MTCNASACAAPLAVPAMAIAPATTSFKENIVRAGVNYKFWTGGSGRQNRADNVGPNPAQRGGFHRAVAFSHYSEAHGTSVLPPEHRPKIASRIPHEASERRSLGRNCRCRERAVGSGTRRRPAASRRPPPRAPVAYIPAAPVFTWTGFYVGLNTGYAFGQSNWSSPLGSSGWFNVNGALAGATIGGNYRTGRLSSAARPTSTGRMSGAARSAAAAFPPIAPAPATGSARSGPASATPSTAC